ncbi:MAG: enoyl-CoA hydratase/isomerase family protein [Burkholderiaceae bacterium]|nr:enoyl-CoA hydratase/isomerase family protein [Burkholderiaceae bacterium]
MTPFISTEIKNQIGVITLDRPQALNSLSLEMIRALTQVLLQWRDQQEVKAIYIRGATGKAFCAGGDIRFFYDAGVGGLKAGSALLEDFFTEEYALNHLIHFYPKPYISLLDGVVMGGGMGIGQASVENQLRIVTERTKMAMPEVNIGLFPDVGGSYFLTKTPGHIGTYLGLSGQVISASDAIYAGLADVFIPSEKLPALSEALFQTSHGDVRTVIRNFCADFESHNLLANSALAQNRLEIDHHFGATSVQDVMRSLALTNTPFAQQTLTTMEKRSPLLMAVTLEQLYRGRTLSVGDCLRMERTMVRHCFAHGEVLEGVRALVIDKDNLPQWRPAQIDEVTPMMVSDFFAEIWPSYAHPLRHLS